MEGGPSVITDLQGALRLHYTYITSKRKIIANMKPNYNVYKVSKVSLGVSKVSVRLVPHFNFPSKQCKNFYPECLWGAPS